MIGKKKKDGSADSSDHPVIRSSDHPFSSWSELCARADRYGREINNYDWLKFAALVIMTIDHVGAYLVPDDPLWWKAVGRITFPVWFFLAGYSQSRKLGGEIIWLALLLQLINFATYQGINPFNALVSIVICRYVVFWLKDRGWIEKYPFEIFMACLFLSPFTAIMFEYGTLGVAYAVMGDMVRRGLTGKRYQIYFWLSTLLFLAWQFVWYDFGPYQGAFVIIGTCYVVWILARFEVRPTAWLDPQGTAAWLVRFIARNTMHYYFAHRALFQIIALLLGITATEQLKLFIF